MSLVVTVRKQFMIKMIKDLSGELIKENRESQSKERKKGQTVQIQKEIYQSLIYLKKGSLCLSQQTPLL